MEAHMLKTSSSTTLSSVAASAIAGLILMIPVAQSQPSVTNLGTLTCTTTGAPENPRADVKLSCNFKAIVGEARDYEGVATRQGAAGFPPGKHVLVWSVIGPGNGDAPALNGMFRGRTGGAGTSALIGGANGALRLEPVTGATQIDAAAALTVLTLTLAPTRA
jgi:Protein of unknown function (DUF992)